MIQRSRYSITSVISLALATTAYGQIQGDLDNPPEFIEGNVETLYYSWGGGNLNEQYGYVSETIADLNDDGVFEMLNSAPYRIVDGEVRTGVAFVHDGRTGDVLFEHVGITPKGFFGWRLGRLGDINADGVDDYAVGAAGDIYQPNPNIEGEVFLYSGADHSLIGHLLAKDYADPKATGLGGDRFGQDVSALSDINGDGKAEFIVTADLWDEDGSNTGKAWIIDGNDFSVIRTHHGLEAGDRFGSSTNPIKDVTGDGIDEYLICARDGGEEDSGMGYVYDGATGNELFRLAGDSPTMNNLGQYFASSPGDCTGDGVADIFITDFTDSAEGIWTGSAYLFDTAAGLANPGEVLMPYWRIIGDETRQSVGFGGGIGDADGDGCQDIATCFLANNRTPSVRWAGTVRVYSGKTGKILRTISSTQGDGNTLRDWGEQFGYSISPLGDANNDGFPDYFITAGFGRNDQGQNIGRIYAIAGAAPCAADFDGDLDVDIIDVLKFLNNFNEESPTADLTDDGVFNFYDIAAYLDAYLDEC